MSRATDPRWQRLRKDKRSGFATALTAFALVPPTVALVVLNVPGTQFEARGNPLYWLLMIPMAWWGARIARYERGALRFIRHTQIAAPLLAAMLTAVAAGRGEDLTPFVVATILSLVLAALAWVLYSGSMLQVEGTVDE